MRVGCYRAVLAFSLTAIVSATFANAQRVPATTLCNTGLAPEIPPPQGCTTSTLVSPINPVDGGPIVDGNWDLAVPYPSVPYTESAPDPCSFATEYSPAPVSTPDSAWYDPLDEISQWIEPLGGGSTPAGWYIYRARFFVPPASSGYHYIFFVDGVLMADNEAVAIYLEDRAGSTKTCGKVAAFTTMNQQYAWNQFQFAALAAPDADAYLYFVVYNQYSSTPTENPTGFRVEFVSPYFVPVK